MRYALGLLVSILCSAAFAQPIHHPQAQVFFSAESDIEAVIVKEIDNARAKVWVQAFLFNSEPIAAALIRARQRGIQVRVVMDKNGSQKKKSQAVNLCRQGVEVFVDDRHAVAHNKIVLVDEDVVMTGSFNFTEIFTVEAPQLRGGNRATT